MLIPAKIRKLVWSILPSALLAIASQAGAQTPSISGITPTSGPVGSSVTILGSGFGSTQGASSVVLSGTAATALSWSDSSISALVPSGATSGPFTVTVNGNQATSVTFSITALPSGWSGGDVGSVTAGSASYANGVFTVSGAGPNYFGSTTDGMHFVYQPLNGDGTIVARVVSTSSNYAQVGLMMRETLSSGAKSAVVVDYVNSFYYGYRATTGGSSSYASASGGTPPNWMKLVRSGSTFSSYLSTDGVNWVQVGTSQTISMATSIYVGLTVGSISATTLYTGTLDNVSLNTSAAPAPVITGVSATTGAVGSQVTITGQNFGSAQGNSLVVLHGTPVTVNSWSTGSISTSIPSGAVSGDLVVMVAPTMNCSNPVEFTVTTTPLPTAWLDQDTAEGIAQGSASYANGVFTVSGAGPNYFGSTTDGMHFVYQPLNGDGTIVARVVSTSNNYAQVGLMMRETLSSGAKSAVMLDYNASVYYGYRTTTGGSSSNMSASGGTPPNWLKLVRSGSTFSSYESTDGVNWIQVGTSQTISMATSIYVGLTVGGISATTLYTGTLDNVSLNTAAAPAPVITGVSATTGAVGSQVTITGQNFGSAQGNSLVVLHGTPVTVNSWSDTSITISIPSGAVSGDMVVMVAPTMNCSNPVEFTLTTTPLPTAWLDEDIGEGIKPGNATYSSGIFTVTGSGNTDLNANTDGFHFAYQILSGDLSIVVRVVSVGYTYAQAGVMVRASLNAQSQQMFVTYYNTNMYGVYRAAFGDTTRYGTAVSSSLPYWVKIVRTGNNFSGYVSPDGTTWTLVQGPVPISMQDPIYVGLAVNSNSSSTLYNATFDNVSISSSSSTAPLITGLSSTNGAVGSQVVISGSGFGASQGNSLVYLNDVSVPVSLWSDTSIAITIPSGATSGLISVAVAPTMNSSNGVMFTVAPSPIPSGWFDQDIGPVGKTGNASYSNGVFTVQGAGRLVTSTADAFHFVYQPLATDGSVVARVVSEPTSAQAGVMMRETLDAGSANVFPYYTFNGSNTISDFGYRDFPNGSTSTSSLGSVTLPYWVKAVRTANIFTCYVSANGVNWTQIGNPQTITTTQQIYVGLGVSSGSTTSLATVTFDNVGVGVGGSLPDPVISGLSPSAGPPGTSVVISGSGFGQTQGSSAVFFNGAAATITGWSDTQITAAVPNSATTGPASVVVGNITGQGPKFSIQFGAQLTDSLGNQTSYSSSIAGGQWSFTDAQGSGCSSCTTRGTVHNQYDSKGNLAFSTDAIGNTTIYGHDSSNNVTSQFLQLGPDTAATTQYTYNSFGEVLTVKDALGNTTTNAYDTKGNLTSVTTPAPNGSTAASVTQFTYNSLGELTQITDPLSHVTTLTYTPAGLIATITDAQSNVTTYGYDGHGNRTSVTDALTHQTTFAYDAGDRLTQITYPDSTTTQFGYDYRGRRTSVTDQNSKTTTYAYDDADRLTSVTDAANNVTTYGYDTESNLTSITDANGHQTIFTYDAYGRVTQTNFPSTLTENYSYDANNNLTSKTDRKGQTIQYVYDALNRLTRKVYPDSTEADYVYDLVGKVLSVNDPSGSYTFAYDNMGRLIGTTTNYAFLTSRSFTTAYTYDKASNRTGFTDPESGSTAYVYDTLNRLQTLTPPSAFTTGSFGFTYDALSRRTQMTRPNNVATNYTYDNLSRLQSVLHQLSGSTIDGASYGLDSAGNRTSKTDYYAGITSNYAYDAIYELTGVTQGTNTTENYTYDPAGNRLSSLGVSPYSVNVSNELSSTPNATYTYDANGNTSIKTDSTGTTNYTWDFENRLTSVTLPGSGGTVSFKYDPFGRRIYKLSSSGTSVYMYDGDNLVEETNSTGAVVARYSQTNNIDEPLAMLRGGSTSFYHVDGLGSVTSLSGSTGSLVQTYTYDSFGKTTASTGTLSNSFQFTAREFDTESGLYFLRNRYYDPQSGRFLNEDPLGFGGDDANFYAYVQNNPVGSVDPFGLQHKPGGPWHPDPGVKFACKWTDSCSDLSAKIGLFKSLIAGHIAFDIANNQPGRHAEDIATFTNGLANCIAIHKAKCTNKQCPPEDPPPVPIPVPAPQREPSRVPVPSPSDVGQAAAKTGLVIIIIRILIGIAAIA